MSMNLTIYADYIRNTGRVPLSCDDFDDDWAPIGHLIRADLLSAGLVTESDDGLTLTAMGRKLLMGGE